MPLCHRKSEREKKKRKREKRKKTKKKNPKKSVIVDANSCKYDGER